MTTAERYHDISCGHRVYGHENKCAHLHGHNYRFHFKIAGRLDSVGRVLDFGVIKEKLCVWLEDNWDHRFLLWNEDPWIPVLENIDPDGLVALPFNPTAENLAQYMIDVIAPQQLQGTDAVLIECRIEETRKCSATANSVKTTLL